MANSRQGNQANSSGDVKPHVLIPIVLATFTLQSIHIWFSSTDRLVTFSLVDDAFYYLNIARHVMHGRGASFDGIHPTNGFQPLWEVLLLPLGLIGSKALSLRLLCTLGALLYNLITVFLYLFVRRQLNGRIALISALLWAFNARLIFTYSLNGMEFSLFALSIMLFIHYYQNRFQAPNRAPASSQFCLGVLWGVCTLSRIDGVLIGGLAVAGTLWGMIRDGGWKRAIQFLGCVLGGFGVTVAPYFAWNILTFAHLLPVSGTIKQHLAQQHLAAMGAGFLGAGHWAYSLREGVFFYAKYLSRFITGYGYYLLRLFNLSQNAIAALGLALLGAAALGAARHGLGALRTSLAKVKLLFIFATIHYAVFALLLTPFIDYGNWYFGPLYLSFCIGTAVIVDRFTLRARGWLTLATGLILILNLGAFLFLHDEPKINIMGAADCLVHLEQSVRGERIGSWNAGYLGFFSERNTVVNLDGLVGDYELAQYHLKGLPIREYLKKNRIQYLCDYQLKPEDIQTEFYGLRPSEFEILYRSPFYQPPFIDSRIYYVVKLK